MKQLFTLIAIFFTTALFAQDYNTLLKEAQNLERQVKEEEALAKYKMLEQNYPNDLTANIKCAQLLLSTGGRIANVKQRTLPYMNAKLYAEKAWQLDSNSAEVNYTMALVAKAFSEVETDNKKIAAYTRQVFIYTSKALAINTNHGKANYLLGKWHMQVADISWAKKTAIKAIYGESLPTASIDTAIVYMEKCRRLEPYYVANYLDLAKAYQQINRPTLALEVLNKLVKLPTRTGDDVKLKEEGKQLLDQTL